MRAERTLSGLIPKEDIAIPIDATIYYGPRAAHRFAFQGRWLVGGSFFQSAEQLTLVVNVTIKRADFSDKERIVKLRLFSQKHFERSNWLNGWITEIGKQLLKQKAQNDLANDNSRIFLAEVDVDPVECVQGEVSHSARPLAWRTESVSLLNAKTARFIKS